MLCVLLAKLKRRAMAAMGGRRCAAAAAGGDCLWQKGGEQLLLGCWAGCVDAMGAMQGVCWFAGA
jgi:hypothetical protein